MLKILDTPIKKTWVLQKMIIVLLLSLICLLKLVYFLLNHAIRATRADVIR